MHHDFRFSVNTDEENAQFQLSGGCTFAAPMDGKSKVLLRGSGNAGSSFSPKTRKKVLVTVEVAAVAWFLKKYMLQCLRMPLFAVNQIEVKKILDLGADVPGLSLVDCATKTDAGNLERGK